MSAVVALDVGASRIKGTLVDGDGDDDDGRIQARCGAFDTQSLRSGSSVMSRLPIAETLRTADTFRHRGT